MSYVKSFLYGISLGTLLIALLGIVLKVREIEYTVSLLVASFIIAGITFFLGRFED